MSYSVTDIYPLSTRIPFMIYPKDTMFYFLKKIKYENDLIYLLILY
jgi:hypothetical protein